MSGKDTGAAPVARPEDISPRLRAVGMIGAILGLALAAIDVSIVATAMPRIANELSGLHLYGWVGTSYAVASVIVIPIAGKLGDMFGRKPFLLAGLVGFMFTSFACGAAQTMVQLVAFRGLQGLFAGVLLASVFTVVGDLFTAERRVQMQGLLFSVSGLSMVIGPPVGGLITDQWSWRWVFYVNIPIGLLAALAVAAAMPYLRSRASWRDIDFLGVLTLAAGTVPVLVGLSLVGTGDAWTSPAVLGSIAGGALVLVGFVLVEARAAHPIVPFSVFRNRTFLVLTVVAFFSAFAMGGTVFFVPLLYQGVLGVSATVSGGLLIPLTLALMIVPPVAGRVLPMIRRYRFLGSFSFACMIAGLWLLTVVEPDTGRLVPLAAMVLVGIGIGVAFPMATSVAQSAVPMEQLGVATSQIQFWRILAGPMVYAILGSILSSRTGGASQASLAGEQSGVSPQQLAAGMHTMFLVAAAMVAVGLLATLFLREVPLRQPPKRPTAKPESKEPTAGRS